MFLFGLFLTYFVPINHPFPLIPQNGKHQFVGGKLIIERWSYPDHKQTAKQTNDHQNVESYILVYRRPWSKPAAAVTPAVAEGD